MFTEPKELCERFYSEVVNGENYDLIEELIAEDFVDHEEFPGLSNDRAGVRQFFELMRSAFPDLSCEVKRMVGEDDTVVVHFTMRGTHQGEFMGVAASGKSIEADAIDIIRFLNDKAVEHWGVTDGMAMMEQIGAFEAEGAAAG